MTTRWSINFIAWTAIIGLAVIMSLKNPKEPGDYFAAASSAVGAAAFIYEVFVRWLWKYLPLECWHGVPYLEGKWAGSLRSNGNTNTGDQPVNRPMTLDIRQRRLGKIKIRSDNDQGRAESLSEAIHAGEDGRKTLSYVYLAKPKPEFRESSPMHHGAVQLEIRDKELSGEYWTDRLTIGSISVTKT